MNNHSNSGSNKKNSTYCINKKLFCCACFFVIMINLSLFTMSVIFAVQSIPSESEFYPISLIPAETQKLGMLELTMLSVNVGIPVRLKITESRHGDGMAPYYEFIVRGTDRDAVQCLMVIDDIVNNRGN